jgi:hypothetical protein
MMASMRTVSLYGKANGMIRRGVIKTYILLKGEADPGSGDEDVGGGSEVLQGSLHRPPQPAL